MSRPVVNACLCSAEPGVLVPCCPHPIKKNLQVKITHISGGNFWTGFGTQPFVYDAIFGGWKTTPMTLTCNDLDFGPTEVGVSVTMKCSVFGTDCTGFNVVASCDVAASTESCDPDPVCTCKPFYLLRTGCSIFPLCCPGTQFGDNEVYTIEVFE